VCNVLKYHKTLKQLGAVGFGTGFFKFTYIILVMLHLSFVPSALQVINEKAVMFFPKDSSQISLENKRLVFKKILFQYFALNYPLKKAFIQITFFTLHFHKMKS